MLIVESHVNLVQSLVLLILNLLVASQLQIMDLPLLLLFFGLFLLVSIWIIHLGITEQVSTIPLLLI